MTGVARFSPLSRFVTLLVPLLGLVGCSASQAPVKQTFQTPIVTTAPNPEKPVPGMTPVMLGIDVLEAEGFAAVKGKRIGLLTHPAGVNRLGIS